MLKKIFFMDNGALFYTSKGLFIFRDDRFFWESPGQEGWEVIPRINTLEAAMDYVEEDVRLLCQKKYAEAAGTAKTKSR